MQEYFRLLMNFRQLPTLCNLLQLVSCDTWYRIEFARTRYGLKIFETTLTQNILYQFRLYWEQFPTTPIRMFEAIDERNNGNDIELIIQTSQGFLIAPLQAKLVYDTNQYDAMDHRNQINDLITYANGVGGVPIYLLYNYYPDITFIYNSSMCGVGFSKEQFGCSLVSANYLLKYYAFNRITKNGIKRWTIPSFTDLHPSIAIPWFVLGCCELSKLDTIKSANLLNNSINTGIIVERGIKTYKLEDLISEKDWKPLEINGLKSKNTFKENANTKFVPKYRIVFFSDNENQI